MHTIGIGLIGSGNRSLHTANLILQQDARLQVRAVFDPDPQSVERARALAPNVRVYSDYHALVKAPDVDWVSVGSWNRFHKDQAVAALQAGKHVFCEKPLALTVEECLAMRDAWRASGKLFTISFTLRYAPHYRRIKQLLEAGAIGDIISMEFKSAVTCFAIDDAMDSGQVVDVTPYWRKVGLDK